MTWTVPSRPDQRLREILRRAAIALKGRGVGVWEADASGRLDLLAASSAEHRSLVATDELELALRKLGELETAHRTPLRWVASRLKRRWCIAPVRSELPPPPGGVERRGPERLTLELAGVCIGLIDAPERHTTASRDAEGQAGLASIVDQVPAILWTTDVELRVTSRSGASARSLDILPERVVGASLLEQHSRDEVRSESIVAHRRALAGEPVSYQIRQADRCYDAHVEPLRGEGGGVVGVVGLAVDGTDRERALTRARRSELELEDFVESAAAGIRWTAPDGTILRANAAELDMLGYGREETWVATSPSSTLIRRSRRTHSGAWRPERRSATWRSGCGTAAARSATAS